MITRIVEELKTGSVKNVVPFGKTRAKLEPPYTVVKREIDSLNRGIGFRIIAHFMPGQNIFLDDYIDGEVPRMLDGFMALSRHGSRNHLLCEPLDADIITNNDDGTISRERVFLMPSRNF